MALDKVVIEMLTEKTGYPVDTPDGCERLCIDILTELNLKDGEGISVNTLKRLTNVLPYEGGQRRSTLDIIARYLGYKNWPTMYNDVTGFRGSSFNRVVTCYDMEELPENTKVGIAWSPNRNIVLQHLGKGEYVVKEVHNSKLRVGDHIWLSQLVLRFPFFAKKVVRDDVNLGNYTSAQEWGIERIRVRVPDKIKDTSAK